MTYDPIDESSQGIALCLSGGGYRAMVFHLGALIRLNEAKLLPRIARVSSVSGGSITAACLAVHWTDLGFDATGYASRLNVVVDAIRAMAGTTIDAGAILSGILLPGSISERVATAYDRHLFKGATLQDLPDEAPGTTPRFVINATNVQTGAVWRFSKPYMGDYVVGLVRDPQVPLSLVVAASSAFPPVLSPCVLRVEQPYDPAIAAAVDAPDFRDRVVLSDGGVYDNLGLETAFKRYSTLLVSDGGMKIAPEAKQPSDWARHSIRILDVVDNQVRSLRKRQLIDAFATGVKTGAYWSIRTAFAEYRLAEDPLGCAERDPREIAATPTRLEAMPDALQKRLINWGYAICDAALRRHVTAEALPPGGIEIASPEGFPFAGGY